MLSSGEDLPLPSTVPLKIHIRRQPSPEPGEQYTLKRRRMDYDSPSTQDTPMEDLDVTPPNRRRRVPLPRRPVKLGPSEVAYQASINLLSTTVNTDTP